MLSQKLSRRKSALMLEDATWFASLMTTRKIQNIVRENAKKHCGEMQPELFYYTSYAFLKALKAFH